VVQTGGIRCSGLKKWVDSFSSPGKTRCNGERERKEEGGPEQSRNGRGGGLTSEGIFYGEERLRLGSVHGRCGRGHAEKGKTERWGRRNRGGPGQEFKGPHADGRENELLSGEAQEEGNYVQPRISRTAGSPSS